MRKSLYLAATAALVTFAAPATWANEASAEEESAQAQGRSSADVESEASGSEILVTARRREERLNDVPISITAIGADSMEQRGLQRVDDLAIAVPSLATRAAAGRRSNSTYEIRGISVAESLLTGDPAVGLYVDEVFRARATGTNQSFFDIANVQVLYGPQGTLFGKSATAGAVLITTNKPTDRFEGELELGIGNFQRLEATAMLNIPFGDLGAIRFAGQRVKQDGFSRNITTGGNLGNTNSWSGRVSLLLKPSASIENVSVFGIYHANEAPSGIYNQALASCPYSTSIGTTTFPNLLSTVPAAGATCVKATNALLQTYQAQQNARGPYQVALDPYLQDWRGLTGGDMSRYQDAPKVRDGYESPRNYSFTNTTTINVSDNIAIKNIFGYNRSKYEASTDLDATPFKVLDTWYQQNVTTVSDELQLQGSSDKFNWVVGAIWFRESGGDIQNSVQGCGGSATLCNPAYSQQTLKALNQSYAIFAQGTYKITPELSVTAGGRFNWDKRRAIYAGTQQANIGINDTAGFALAAAPSAPVCILSSVRDDRENLVIQPGQPCTYTQERSFTEPTYTFTADFKPSDGILLYASHRLGYRSGGLQSRIAANARLIPFRPETVKDVEIGFKGNFRLDSGVSIRSSLAVYKSWWSDLQRSTSVFPVGSTTSTTVVSNAAKATVQGFEASLGITPVPALSIDGYLGHVDGKYKEFATIIGGVPTAFNIPFNNARWTGGVTAVVTPIDSPETGTVRLVGDLAFRTISYADNPLPVREPQSNLPASTFLNLSIAWENIVGSKVSARAWMRNVTNQVRVGGVTGLLNSFGIAPTVLAEPRTFGLTLGYKFGR